MKNSELSLTSEWNQAQLQQFRMHEIMTGLRQATITNNYSLWHVELWNLLRELSANMKQEEIKKAEELLDTANKEVSKRSGLGKPFKKLMDADIYLRDVMRERGLLNVIGRDPGKALLEDKSY